MWRPYYEHGSVHKAYAQRYYDQYTCDIKIIKLEKYGVPEPENEGDKKKIMI